LRAISVLAVVLYHVKAPGFAGGFVGVDVFFVISGYLITQLLMAPSERSLGSRLRAFYVRRCRRILPALLAMLIASAAVACWCLLPSDLARFGTQLTFTMFFVGNLFLWRSAGGYFDQGAPVNPLLHVWSIAVEEQFYVLFPLVFWASTRASRKAQLALVAGAGLASLALCVWASYHAPVANFFLAPPRAWELLLGSVLALGVGRRLSTHRARDALAGGALLALLACVAGYDSSLRYPGLYTVVPCLCAAVLLATASETPSRTSRWLSARPLVFTGAISYSLYLWHLPVLAFAQYVNVVPFRPSQIAGLLAAIYLLSAVSWRYVEEPVRRRKWPRSDRRLLALVSGATAAVGVAGVIMWQSQGLPGRLDAIDAKLIAGDGDRMHLDLVACSKRPLTAIAAGQLCGFGPAAGAQAQAVVWGDSHSVALVPAYERIAMERNVRVHLAWFSSCRPLLDAASESVLRYPQLCNDFNHAAVSAIQAIDPEVVILNARWTYPDLDIVALNGDEPRNGQPEFERALERTLSAIGAAHRRVCVVGDVPSLKYVMPYAYVMARRRGLSPNFIARASPEAEQQQQELDEHFAALRPRYPFTFVDPRSVLCAQGSCAILSADGRSLYRDDNHLTAPGALLLVDSLEACFDGVE
jgi:peptidoglycan/LPS O-acetylase OafA/YrhL